MSSFQLVQIGPGIPQANIQSAVQQNASSEQLGTLWLTLADRYQDRFELEKAEDAYARAIRLLRDTSPPSQYAESLHGMGNVYGASGRLKESRKFLTKSLYIYRSLNDEANIARLHVELGAELLAEYKYRKAETESTAALEYSSPHRSPMSVTCLPHISYAVVLPAARDGAASRSMICHGHIL